MRARYPDTEGFIERDGVKVAYEVFGSGEPALVFTPTDPLVHSRLDGPADGGPASQPGARRELGLSQQAPGLSGFAQHVRQPMLPGEPRGPVQFGPGLLPAA